MTFLGRALTAAGISLLLTLLLLLLFQESGIPTEEAEAASQTAPVTRTIAADTQRN